MRSFRHTAPTEVPQCTRFPSNRRAGRGNHLYVPRSQRSAFHNKAIVLVWCVPSSWSLASSQGSSPPTTSRWPGVWGVARMRRGRREASMIARVHVFKLHLRTHSRHHQAHPPPSMLVLFLRSRRRPFVLHQEESRKHATCENTDTQQTHDVENVREANQRP